jgi:hypothetical protein
MKSPRDHHLVPQFLLDPWCKPNGKVTVYTRVKGLVLTSEERLKNTALKRDRSFYPRIVPGRQPASESELSAWHIDARIPLIVQKLMAGDRAPLTTDERLSLMRFLVLLLERIPGPDTAGEPPHDPEDHPAARAASPPLIEWFEPTAHISVRDSGGRDSGGRDWGSRDWGGRDSTVRDSARSQPRILVDDAMGARMLEMPWYTYDAREASTDFIIGDRPCLFEGSAVSDGFIIALPLSPRVMFVVCGQPMRIEGLRRARVNDVVNRFNRASVSYAAHRVYSTGIHHMPLVAQHLRARAEPF